MLCFRQSGLKPRPTRRALIQNWLNLEFFRKLKSTPGAPFAQDDGVLESCGIPPIRNEREWMGHKAFVDEKENQMQMQIWEGIQIIIRFLTKSLDAPGAEG